jgi:SAM-dependent methyltransferase
MSPLSNAYLQENQLHQGETFYPLNVMVCEKCLLVQLPEYERPETIFSDYAYFSSYSESWIEHARLYSEKMISWQAYGKDQLVVEIASNDGYLLKNFVAKGIPVLGIEPAANVAEVAENNGVKTEVAFFGEEYARQLVANGNSADLVIGNNVLAHVPDINDFVAGMKLLLKTDGIITMEFPHLLKLITQTQFDTIYHEHFSYLSLEAVSKIFEYHQLKIFDVEELATHGGSLRIYARHIQDQEKPVSNDVHLLMEKEKSFGLDSLKAYTDFNEQVMALKRQILEFFITAKNEYKTIVGYGAPAKGNTLLNYCGIRQDFIEYTVDLSPHKQGRFLPGTHIPIYAPQKIYETRPDYVFILPWNLQEEIMAQLANIRQWGGKFVVPIPGVQVIS